MKYLVTIGLVGMSLFLTMCGFFSKPIHYVFEDGGNDVDYVFSPPINADSIPLSIKVWTNEQNPGKKEPLTIGFIMSDKVPNVETLESIQVWVFQKNELDTWVTLSSNYLLKLEFFNGKNLITKTIKDTTTKLNSLIDWKDVNYKYDFNGVIYEKKGNAITFSGSTTVDMKQYPDTLKLIVNARWGAEEKSFEKILTKEEYVGPKINPKF